MLNPEQQHAFDLFVPAAVSAERESAGWLGVGYPAEVTLAQWAAETGWSLKKVTGDWNCFGLTAATCPARPRKFCPTQEQLTVPQFLVLPTDERESVTGRVDLGQGRYRYSLSRWFACFDSLEPAIGAYIRLITAPGHRYASAWQNYAQSRNIDALMDGIAHAGYATGGGYGATLHQIAHQENVRLAIQAART